MKILLIGDSCIDEYIYGTCDRLSPEQPVPVLKYTRTTTSPGMAANVKLNLEAFGANVTFVTNWEPILKERLVDERTGNHIVRIDTEGPVTPLDVTKFLDADLNDLYDCIVISDYNKGFVTTGAIQWIRKKFVGPIFVDTKKQDLFAFEGCFVKINELEYAAAKTLCTDLIVTRGKHGATYQGFVCPAPQVNVHDVCGAGDTFLAALAYRYCWNNLQVGGQHDIVAAIEFANKSSAITVQHNGVYVLTDEDIKTLW